MKENKLLYTVILSCVLFLFLGLSIYSLYCFAYYNRHQEIIYIDYVNKGKYDFLYTHLAYQVNRRDFDYEIDLLFNKSHIETIYETYYEDKGIYSNKESFLDTYYYGNQVTNQNVVFQKEGKTNLFRRRNLSYDAIILENNLGNKTKFTLFQRIRFQVDNGATLLIDEEEVTCEETICFAEEMLGGLHTLTYKIGNMTYYGLFTINKDDTLIHISTLDSLVLINKEVFTVATTPLDYGDYVLTDCYLQDRHYCPSTNHSYIRLQDKEHFTYYTYITYSKAGDYCEGTYKIDGRFVTFTCDTHVHKVFDYDTQIGTDVVTKTEVEYQYKISNENTLENKEYQWKFYK